MRRAFALGSAAVLVGLLAVPLPTASAIDGVTEVCRFADPRFTEISGMTYSQRHDGVIYLHNDSSGGPLVFAVDAATCQTLATLTIRGIEARDIEAIGSGRDAKGRPVLWVADIGDNVDSWPEVRLHRVREPKVLRDRSVKARTYRFTYPDRPHNAEALLADPESSRVWVVTKQSAAGRIYALPEPLSRTRINVAEPVGDAGGFVTDASVSPDGSRFAIRDYVDAEVRTGKPPGTDPQRVYLPLQVQGEAMTWTPDGSALLVAGEKDDRLLRVDVTPAASTGGATDASPSQPPPPSLSAGLLGDSDGENAQQPRTQQWGVVVAGGLIAAAVALIGLIEWRRRRSPGRA